MSRISMNIDWNKIDYFREEEFPEDPETYADPFLIYSLDKFRAMLGAPVYPSPVSGALARFDKKSDYSRHYAVERKSDAIDVYCKAPIFQAWSTAISCELFNGVGVYFDTHYKNKHWCMLHLDRRRHKSLWLRNYHKYTSTESTDFWEYLLRGFYHEI